MTHTTDIGLDEVLKIFRPFGKYTIYNYALLFLPCFNSGIIGPAYNFEALDISYRCNVPGCEVLNDTTWLEYAIPQEKGEFSKCKVYQYNNETANKCSVDAFNTEIIQECNSYVYGEQDSVVKDFNLGCQNWKRTLIGTVHNAGYFIALPITGLISDKYGRTIAVSIASLMNGIFGLARSFSTNYNMMLVFEFMESSLGAGHSTTVYVMAMELARPKGRAVVHFLINFVHVIGIVTLTALAWWLQSWRTLLRVIFSIALIPSCYFLILKESPRWLISKGRHEEAKTVLRNAAKLNKIELPENVLNSIEFMNNNPNSKAEPNKNGDIEQTNKPSLFWQVLKSKILVVRLLICSYMWMSGSFIYYGLSINSVSLAGNKYLNFMLVSFVEIPANMVLLFLINRFGRKRLIFTTFLLSGSMCICLSLLPKDQTTLLLIMYLAGKFFSGMTYSSIYIYVSEVFPTQVRQTLLSFCSTVGRVGTTLAPLTPLLAFYYKNLPAIFFGCVALLASMLIRFLPETINTSLPNNVEDAENISKQNT